MNHLFAGLILWLINKKGEPFNPINLGLKQFDIMEEDFQIQANYYITRLNKNNK